MAVRTFLRSSGLAALALGIAVVAVPGVAMAQDEGQAREHRGHWNNSAQPDEQVDRGDRAQRGGGDGGQRQEAMPQQAQVEQAQARVEAQQAQVQQQAQAQQAQAEAQSRIAQAQAQQGNRWNGVEHRDGEHRDGWRGRDDQQQQAQQQAARQQAQQQRQAVEQQQQAQRQAEASRGWQGRNASEQQRGDWAGRNRSSTDQNRDRSDGGTWHNDQNRRTWQTQQGWQNRQGYNPGYNQGYNPGYTQGYQGNYAQNNQRWNRNWRQDNRYNWSAYRNQHRDVFRSGSYYSPYRNYSYRSLSIGVTLGSLFYSDRYWIEDPWSYRLPQVDGPYRWVRYYDDVLLVDVYSGEVVDVIRNFFW